MADTIVILTEEALQPSDADQIVALYADQDVAYRVFVPADTERNVVTDFLDYLAVGELKEAWESAMSGEPTPAAAKHTAAEELDTSLAELRQRGGQADGVVVPDDPMPAVVEALLGDKARELLVVTRPHPIAETFRRDWASRARSELGVPVLHLYGGTDRIVG